MAHIPDSVLDVLPAAPDTESPPVLVLPAMAEARHLDRAGIEDTAIENQFPARYLRELLAAD